MPEYVCARVADALNDREKSVKGSRILVLGVAYKRDVDDVRESPALDILQHPGEARAPASATTTRTCRELELDGRDLRSRGPDAGGARARTWW